MAEIEKLDREQIAKLIEDQATKIAKLTELLTELRVGGRFGNADAQTKKALRETDELLGPEIGTAVLKTLAATPQ